MKPSKAEKILGIAFLVSAVLMFSTLAILTVARSIMPPQLVQIVTVAFWVSDGLTLLTVFCRVIERKKRLAENRERFAKIMRESVSLPDFSKVESSDAVLSLFCTQFP
jgi:hypothetical protein